MGMLVSELLVSVNLLFVSVAYFLPFLNSHCTIETGMQVMESSIYFVEKRSILNVGYNVSQH